MGLVSAGVTIILVLCAILGVLFGYLQWKGRKKDSLQIKIITNYFPDIKLEEVPKNEKELKERINEKYGFIREDLLEQELYVATPIARYKRIIEILNKYLNKTDVDIIISSSAVCRAEDEEKHSLAKQLHVSLIRLHGKRAKRTYNMLKANIFDENILPYVRELERFLPKDIIRISKMLQEYFDNLIEHELIDRLWVSNDDNYMSVFSRIKHKFSKDNKLDILYIYVRKRYNISFTELACQEFLRINPKNFDLKKIKQKEIRGEESITFQIIKKKTSSSTSPKSSDSR